MENDTNCKCFVPSCTNRRFMAKKPVYFFQVPEGIQGHFWAKAVKNKQSKFDPGTELPSSQNAVYEPSNRNPNNVEYCCEVHFDIENDVETSVGGNGVVQYKIRPGVVPSIEPLRAKKLLLQIQESEVDDNNVSIKSECVDPFNQIETTNHVPETNFISLVDISRLTYQKPSYEAEGGVNFQVQSIEPMMPLTIALMKRKPTYYMGLDQTRFANLLQTIVQATNLDEPMILLTLRKLHRNEEFEMLGDLFDIDQRTAERYYEDSKNLIKDVKDVVANSMSEQQIKIEPCADVKVQIHCDDDDKSTASTPTNYGSEPDPDVTSDDLESSDSADSDCEIYDTTYSSASSNSSLRSPKGRCPICNQSCRDVDRHIGRAHLNLQNLNKTVCGLCLENFQNKSNLRMHQKERHNGCAYGCDICAKQYFTYPKLKMHIFVNHSPELKTHLCHQCGDGFAYERLLKTHMQKKHSLSRDNACHLCDKSYIHRASLDIHVRAAHSGERPFKCEVPGCSKSFARESSLRQHKVLHSEIKHACEVCSKQFSWKWNLRVHRKNVHGLM